MDISNKVSIKQELSVTNFNNLFDSNDQNIKPMKKNDHNINESSSISSDSFSFQVKNEFDDPVIYSQIVNLFNKNQ